MNYPYYHELIRDNMAVLIILHEIWHAPIIRRENFRNCKNKAVFLNYSNLKIWTARIITSWIFCKNKAVLLNRFENFNCLYYDGLQFSQKIREFLWYHLKIWTAPIITSWNFCKNIPFLMKPFELSHYHEV